MVDDHVPDVTGLVLTYSHAVDMASHMKTTLNIHPAVMAQLRREAARRGCTMSELVESALQLLLQITLPPIGRSP
jgi:hypothetical protein